MVEKQLNKTIKLIKVMTTLQSNIEDEEEKLCC